MNRLKELRQEKKLTQQELADQIDFPLRTYQRLENGESQIKPDKAQSLADFFGVSVGYLLGYSDKELRNNLAHGVGPRPKLIKTASSSDEISLIASYRLLSLENQKRIKEIAENLVENQVYSDPVNMIAVLDRYSMLYGENEGITRLKESALLLSKITNPGSN